ncbi:dehydrogenase [Microbacterium sp. Root53]|uniref:SDR family NAD(P)-dependent oxidoreductase n=1 Tax=Microbacterium sp. Root53 TaxID=1736553 RepID=UPI0006F4CC2B|nr:SDR family oxidoreductase [Microbacterium sp. Root53]KQZ11732.1 dehydrogenase [Microbacterium sp. Root53]
MSNTTTAERGAVIITGAAHGIGSAYADRLSSDGYPIVIADLDEAGAKAKAEALIADGGRALAVRADISKEEDVQALVDAAVAEFGTITGLVNNAAVFSVVPMSRAPYDEIGLDEWDLMMRVNLRGTWQMCKAVAPHMAKNGYGKIVNISSGTALKGSASRIHYVTSKAGILGFTKTLAREVGADGIRVNCIAPGSTLSEENASEKDIEYRKSRVGDRALGRVQMPEDLSGAVSFFISPDSDFVTGQTLVVDGGSCMH